MSGDAPRTPARPVDMSPEAIAARLRRVVELNRLCRSLAAAAPAAQDEPRRTEDDPGPQAAPPANLTAR